MSVSEPDGKKGYGKKRVKEIAAYLASLSGERAASFSRNSGWDPGSSNLFEETLAAMPGSLSDFLAVTGVRIAADGDIEFALELGRVAVEVAETTEEAQLAHVCLAQVHFKGRKDPQHLVAFESECEEAVKLGHAGTFCYERLAVLYEHRGDLERATGLCEKAVEVLSAAGDERSAESFRKRLRRVRGKKSR